MKWQSSSSSSSSSASSASSNLVILTILLTVFHKQTSCAPADSMSPGDSDKTKLQSDADINSATNEGAGELDSDTTVVQSNPQHRLPVGKQKQSIDYYDYRHVVADGVQQALDECRQKFKWDRWNCPKKAFLTILDREEYSIGHSSVPSNKEFGLTRALIASGIVLSMIRSCSYGTNSLCSCSNPTTTLVQDGGDMPAAPYAPISNETHRVSGHDALTKFGSDTPGPKFVWGGCDEAVKFGFKVAKIYLDSLDALKDETSRLINAHNYEAGRQAVKRTMKRRCKCHGPSGVCQVNTCWTIAPDMSEVGDYLKRQYQVAAKVGASTAKETDPTHLGRELAAIRADKLVFADASPDYCYENKNLGINGTLDRYCSRAKFRPDGAQVSRSERDSCDRLCTKCGYKIKKVRLNVEKQCDCRFVYCCSVECRRCPRVEEAYKCVRHS